MLIAFDSLHNTESMGTSQFSREQRYNEIRFKFCKFAGGKRKFAGDQQEKTHGREKQRHHLESAPPPISIHTSTAPWAFSVLAFLWTRVLSYLTHAMGILGSSGREPCDLRPSEYVTRDAACHSIPLSLDQFRPQWSPSSTAPRVDYGWLYPGLYAHETHFQGERKASPFFLPSPFPFILLIRLLFLPGIFSLTISPNFSNTFILTKPQVHSSDHDTYWKEKKNTSSGLFCFTFVQKRFPIEQWQPGLCNLYIHFNPSKNQQGPHQSRAFINL